MYGLVHEAVVAWLLSREDGEADLQQVLEMCASGDTTVSFYRHYDDDDTSGLIMAAAVVTRLPEAQVLQGVGESQLQILVDMGYLPLVKSLGTCFYDMLQNLDGFHLSLSKSYPKLKAPSFRVERTGPETCRCHYFSNFRNLAPYAQALLKSTASAVYNIDIIISLVQSRDTGADHDIFEITMPERGFRNSKRAKQQSKVATPTSCPFAAASKARVAVAAAAASAPDSPHAAATRDCPHAREVAQAAAAAVAAPAPAPVPEAGVTAAAELTAAEMDGAFPWHVACDQNLRITSLGSCLAPRFAAITRNTALFSLVRIMHPLSAGATFEGLSSLANRDVLLLVRDTQYLVSTGAHVGTEFESNAVRSSPAGLDRYGSRSSVLGNYLGSTGSRSGSSIRLAVGATAAAPSPTGSPRPRRTSISRTQQIDTAEEHLYLRGEFVVREDGQGLIFLGTPSFSTVDHMLSLGVTLDDLPVHSNGRELLHGHMHQRATVSMAQELFDTRSELDQAVAELKFEQRKQETLLHSILPKDIALQLAQGVRPPARKHANVSMLFSDIVNFTTVSSNASPTEIMVMLDDLFSRFDALCARHGVYKLETIGDAYLVTSGLPQACERHADQLAAFAIDMLAASRGVMRPDTGEQLQIRIGLHTGSVVAGVAGTSRPRYCVFGDTVNVASRMESTSEPGRIQISGEFRRELIEPSRFRLTSRGYIDVKGKGKMCTFFLDGLRDEYNVRSRSKDATHSSSAAVSESSLSRSRRPSQQHRPRAMTVTSSVGTQPLGGLPLRQSLLYNAPSFDSGLGGLGDSYGDSRDGTFARARCSNSSGSGSSLASAQGSRRDSELAAVTPRSPSASQGHRRGLTRCKGVDPPAVAAAGLAVNGSHLVAPSPTAPQSAAAADAAAEDDVLSVSGRSSTSAPDSPVRPSGLERTSPARVSARKRAELMATARVSARSPMLSGSPSPRNRIERAAPEDDVLAPLEDPFVSLVRQQAMASQSSSRRRLASDGISLVQRRSRRPRSAGSIGEGAAADSCASEPTLLPLPQPSRGAEAQLEASSGRGHKRPKSAPCSHLSATVPVGEVDFDVKIVDLTPAATEHVLAFVDGSLKIGDLLEGLPPLVGVGPVATYRLYVDSKGHRALAPALAVAALHAAMVRRYGRSAEKAEICLWRGCSARSVSVGMTASKDVAEV